MRWLAALCPVCQHHACTVESHQATPAVTVEPAVAATETVRCACGKRATVTVRLIPRPHKPFAQALSIHSCPSCLESVKARGAVLDMRGIPQQTD